MTNRSPYDGRPYYCIVCGDGFGEFVSCELPDCTLESEADALLRQRRKRHIEAIDIGQSQKGESE